MDGDDPAGKTAWSDLSLISFMLDHDETNEANILARAVCERRRGLGMTREQLARLAGLGCSHVDDIEQAKANPTLAVLIRLSRVLGISVSDLLR